MNSWISRNDSIYGPLGLVSDSFIGLFFVGFNNLGLVINTHRVQVL